MKRESVLTEKDKESIEIVQFIFHIIIEKDAKPLYLNVSIQQTPYFPL